MDATRNILRCAYLGAVPVCFLFLFSAVGADLTLTVSGPETQPIAGQPASFWLNALNTSTQKISWTAPLEIHCELHAQQNLIPITARLREIFPGDPVDITPGAFARREYAVQLPETVVGDATIEFTNLVSVNLMLKIQHDHGRRKTVGSRRQFGS